MAEGLALLCVSERRFEGALGDARGLRGDADASAIESRERDLVAFAFVADAIRHRNFAIGEGKFGAGCGVNAQFFFFLADVEAGRAFFDDQRGDSLLAFFRMRVHVDDARRRPRRRW